MKSLILAGLVVLLAGPAQAQPAQSRFADVNDGRLHYLVAGRGDPVVLRDGDAQTSHMWRPLMTRLARTHTAIAPDLRGIARTPLSIRPSGGTP